MLIFKKEKQVVELVREHVSTTEACLKTAQALLQAYIAGDAETTGKATTEVHRLESQADKLLCEIRDVLYSGAFLPELRAEMYRLVDLIDSIAGQGEEVAKFLECQPLAIPETFQARFIEIFSLSVACFNELNRAMKSFLKPKGKFEKLEERSNRVGQLESDVDLKEAKVTRQIFESDLEYAHKLHLVMFLDIVTSIADKTENAADELVFTALKSSI